MAAEGRKVAIITGANSGIGESIARTLARDGTRVFLVARNEKLLGEVADSIRADGGEAAWISTDLMLATCGETVRDAALAAFGRIDILVNCASATVSRPFAEISDDQWLAGLTTKVMGALRLFTAVQPHISETKGAVINIGGVGARTPRQARGTTGVLSSALMALTKIFADLGLKGGFRVNMINPGSVVTPRSIETWQRRADAEGISVEEVMTKQAREWSSVRIGTPEDTSNLVRYILSEEGSLLHGSIIDLDGGTTKGL